MVPDEAESPEGLQGRCAVPQHDGVPTDTNAEAFWILQFVDRHHHRNAGPTQHPKQPATSRTKGVADFSAAPSGLPPSCKERSRERPLRNACLPSQGRFRGGAPAPPSGRHCRPTRPAWIDNSLKQKALAWIRVFRGSRQASVARVRIMFRQACFPETTGVRCFAGET